jgi:M6 family metalloprotease-like protein
MKKVVFCITFVLAQVLICRSVSAVTANPAAFEVQQPDGKTIQIHIRGDERFHWYEDLDGYTVVEDNGRYAYGQLDKDKRLTATSLTVGTDNPKSAGLQKRILPPVEVRQSMNPRSYNAFDRYTLSGSQESSAPAAAVSPTGTVKNLVILCKFSDHTFGVHTRDAGDYNILFNQTGGDPTLAPSGSVKDLFLQNSYNVMTLQSTITAWVTLPNTEAYYANGQNGFGAYPQNAQKMVEDALNLADPLVDFSQFDDNADGIIDLLTVIHSGYGSEAGGAGIWSHTWGLASTWTSAEGISVDTYHTEPALNGGGGNNIVSVGIIAHETGHALLGLPDLYDTDGSGNGLGSWCLMAYHWGFSEDGLHPPQLCAWSKTQVGWMTPTVITNRGTYTVGQAETNPQAYRINYGYPSGEYLLIENRQPVGTETTMPQGGLCIYHIDDLVANSYTEGYPGQDGWPQNGNHYRVALLQADGFYDLEKKDDNGDKGDIFYSTGSSAEISFGSLNYPNTDAYQSGNIIVTYNTLYNISAASSSMSFVYNNRSNTAPTVSITSPANGATFTGPASITINATASDSGGTISKVVFYESHQGSKTYLGIDSTSPYSYTWSNVDPGSYDIIVRSVDNGGAISAPSTVSVTVNYPPNNPPTVSITSPVEGATFTEPANITIEATASDSDGTISKVEFFGGSQGSMGMMTLGIDTTAPYSGTWNNMSAGNYSLMARATDNGLYGGATTDSVKVNISVTAATTTTTASTTTTAATTTTTTATTSTTTTATTSTTTTATTTTTTAATTTTTTAATTTTTAATTTTTTATTTTTTTAATTTTTTAATTTTTAATTTTTASGCTCDFGCDGSLITPDFIKDGAGAFCWQATTCNYINSYNMNKLEVNGTDYTNMYVFCSNFPPKINGVWYIYCESSVTWSHFELRN